MRQIMVIEDNAETKILLEAMLNDYALTFCDDLHTAKQNLERTRYDLILLDLGLPDGNGMQLLTEFGRFPKSKDTPVIILSGKGDTSNKVMAFSVGAEDFVTKPFDPMELKARVTAKLRKAERQKERSETFDAGDLRIDVNKQKVVISKSGSTSDIDLTSLEFRLLLLFVKSPERVFTRENLLDSVWGHDVVVTDRTVDTHIGHLRKKISKSSVKIETVVGSGYRFIP